MAPRTLHHVVSVLMVKMIFKSSHPKFRRTKIVRLTLNPESAMVNRSILNDVPLMHLKGDFSMLVCFMHLILSMNTAFFTHKFYFFSRILKSSRQYRATLTAYAAELKKLAGKNLMHVSSNVNFCEN